MSRVGNKPVPIPAGVQVTIEDALVRVKGPKAELSLSLPGSITVQRKEAELVVVAGKGDGVRALHGMVRARLANIVSGVQKDFAKGLELSGLGYRAELAGEKLKLTLGFSHPVEFALPKGVRAEVDKKQTKITVMGADKDLVGETAARIRALKEPEPYKGFGIKYEGERIHRKAGKTAAGAGAGGAKK